MFKQNFAMVLNLRPHNTKDLGAFMSLSLPVLTRKNTALVNKFQLEDALAYLKQDFRMVLGFRGCRS